jgi:hypothetical protein
MYIDPGNSFVYACSSASDIPVWPSASRRLWLLPLATTLPSDRAGTFLGWALGGPLKTTGIPSGGSQRYWVFGLCPSSGFFLNNNEKIRTMDKVRKPNISVSYTPSSEPYSIYFWRLCGCSHNVWPLMIMTKRHEARGAGVGMPTVPSFCWLPLIFQTLVVSLWASVVSSRQLPFVPQISVISLLFLKHL